MNIYMVFLYFVLVVLSTFSSEQVNTWADYELKWSGG